jgi:signal transduction histidine kinase
VQTGELSLRPLRLKLTVWYVATLSATIALLGGGLFLAIGHRYTAELNDSLRDATIQVERAAATREYESGLHGNVVDALTELHIPDRTLYLLDSAGTPIIPAAVPDWVRAAVARLQVERSLDVEHHVPHHDETLRLHGERFTLASGRTLIAAAVADNVELEDRYAALITAFSAAAAIALVLVAIGGWLLVRQATAPIESNIARMRRFMADAAHELRTPITVLRAQAEVALQRERDLSEYVAALHGIESESRRMGRLVDDLLTLARADSGDRPASFAAVFLDDIVADAVGAAAAMAAARGVVLDLGQFEEAPVQGDAELLRQLVMILLDNAIKFTPAAGHVSVSVGRSGGVAELKVADTGPGITAAQLPHLFERFYRGDPARGRAGPGSIPASGAGLGLSIAHWIADAHRATIQVASTAGEGTIVSVQFPSAPVSSS